ncbi:MAG: Gfo/Idh/MocA family oxidoreductase, partial [Magnetococcales bacterium]|nr:Gfo/Idh/MocA family oxidoreductase [Magnetococcales bacterium]
GVVGKRRQEHADRHPDLITVAVCDRYFEHVEGIKEGDKAHGMRRYTNYSTMLEREDLDILFVCLTNDIAAEVTIAGLEAGLHVFCEKPPGRNLDDLLNVMACEKRHPNLKLKYGFNHRYHDSVRDALEIVHTKQLGEVLNMRGVYGKSKIISFDKNASNWRTQRALAGGGILLDQGIHLVDLLRLFAGSEFSEIHSFISNDFWKHDIEDNAFALMRTPDRKVAFLHSSATQWRHRFNLEISLEKGTIILSGILSGSKSYGAETLTVAWASDEDKGDPKEQTTRYVEDPSWADEIAVFTEAIQKDGPIVDGSSKDALATMRLVFQIYCADPEWQKKWGLSADIPE